MEAHRQPPVVRTRPQEIVLQLRGKHIVRNVLFNWLGTGIGMAAGFFLSPFILHRLGNLAYAVWVLSVSVVGYMNLLDLGMQNSVLRFVSKGYTQGDHNSASEIFSAAMWVRAQISLLVIVLSVGLGFAFPHLFTVPPELAGDAQKAVMLIGASAAVTMLMGAYGAVLSGLNRYDLQNVAGLVQTAIRVTGVVVVLHTGHGIVAIAICELLATISGNLLMMTFARKLYPALRMHFRVPRREVLRRIWSYSIYVFLSSVATQLVYQTDNIVVGAFVATAAVTFYAIANSLCRYALQVISSIGQTFVPAASTYEAAGDAAGLLQLYTNGTRAMLIVSLPMMLTLMIRGKTFIGLWMGPAYAHTSGMVLMILSISMLLGVANRTAAAIAFGIEKHKAVAIQAICEGVANLVLSIILARRYGIYGVAIGTLVPSAIAQLIFWPLYTPRLVPLRSSEVISRIWAPVCLAAVPFAAVSYVVDRRFPAHSLLVFALQLCATLPVFFGAIALLFRSFVQSQIMPRLRSALAQGAS